MTTFADVMAWPVDDDGVARGRLPERWMQGRGAYGGITAALALEAALRVVPDVALRSVIVQFLGPVRAEVETACRAELLKAGRTISVVEARVEQEGTPRTLVHATFGAGRRSGLHIPTPPAPAGAAPDDGVRLSHIPGVTPQFLQGLELRWLDGQPPFTGASEDLVGGWCRHLGDEHGWPAVLGLLDAWPGPVLPLGTGPFPASSVHWTAHLVASEPPPPGAWLRFRATGVHAADGYHSFVAHLWDERGALVAWSEQLVAVFDAPRD